MSDHYRITSRGEQALAEISRRVEERGISDIEAFRELEHEIYEQLRKEHAERLARTSPEVLADICAGRRTWNDVRRGEMTTREAGRKGGEVTAQRHGSEFYQEIGRKGGQRTQELLKKGKHAEEQGCDE